MADDLGPVMVAIGDRQPYGHCESLADLFRQIGYDERLHKLQSEAAMKRPRFH